MKKIFFAVAVLCSVSACTKHDPFDALLGDVWILSRFAPENYSYQSGQSYFPYDELRQVGLFDTPIADASGKYYRMPTSGELQMIFPQAADDNVLGQYNLFVPLNFAWTPTQDKLLTILESAPLDNLADNTADLSGRKVEGDSEYFYHEEYEDGNPDFFPVYALRFKGTSQYAAYRYEILTRGEDNDIHYVINLKARWLRAKDTTTKIEDIIKDSYWKSGYLELNIPCLSYEDSQGYAGSMEGRLMSSTLRDGLPVVGMFDGSNAGLYTDYGGISNKYPVRLIRCKSDGKL